MRRLIFSLIAFLEVLVAAALISLGQQLPQREQVEGSFSRAERVTQRAADQARRLRQQVRDLRRPELQQLASRLQTQMRTVTTMMRQQSIDFHTVAAVRDSLGAASEGVHNLSQTLDPAQVAKMGEGLAHTANFLEDRLIPAADSAATKLEQSTILLREDARLLSAFLKTAPVDFKVVRQVHDSLDTFGKGLGRMGTTLDVKRLQTMREGFKGMETALATGAEQVERLSNFTYPVITFDGLRPEVDRRQFWPQGDRIAEGLRKAARGVTAASKEVDELAQSLPELRAAVEASRKVVDATRDTLAATLEQQASIEPLLREMPQHAVRLAERLPQVGEDLARVLRDTHRLREVAAALRQAQKGIDMTVQRWPELRKTMVASADLLQGAQHQLDQVVKNQREYERALHQTASLTEVFGVMLPLLTEQMNHKLGEDEKGLTGLCQSLDEVSTVLPEYGHTAGGLTQTGRLLAWLAAAIVLLHGGYLFLCVILGRSWSA